jgi:hypothetical protein
LAKAGQGCFAPRLRRKVLAMLDLVLVVLALALFAATYVYARACERL